MKENRKGVEKNQGEDKCCVYTLTKYEVLKKGVSSGMQCCKVE
jgi:hypothetical protein